jgi:hypothetical protein
MHGATTATTCGAKTATVTPTHRTDCDGDTTRRNEARLRLPTSAPRIAPPGIAIPVEVDAFAPPPTCPPGIVPLGLAIPLLSQVLAFSTAAPPFQFMLSAYFPNQLHK